ncbi:hypothetical protein N7470_008401 [Penicillium chermesinum]|nr:hypothetical protein N7470_008401 [Penicillium chermesinum]
MDVAEDRDVKLQRASSDLVAEFSAKLPSLLWRSSNRNPQRTPRKWAPESKTEKLVSLLEPFQEWPQLLDPHLQQFLPPLVDAFLAYLVRHRVHYHVQEAQKPRNIAVYPLPRSICRLLYTFCKVRGVKVISRFLNNEPKYLDSMLRAFIEWNAADRNKLSDSSAEPGAQGLLWEERYVMLIWLSHLLLAPFDLSSLSSDDIPIPYDNLSQIKGIPPETPVLAKSVLSVALKYINVPGKEREAATALLARIALRGDMQALGLLTRLTHWAFSVIQPAENSEIPTVYSCIGVLSFIARLAGSGQLEDFAPLLRMVFEQILVISNGTSEVSQVIASSAIARKTVVKILRCITAMALSLSERGDPNLNDDQLSAILEEAIDHFLVSLADKDTPVRFAASKALTVIGSLGENILYETYDGTLMTPFEARMAGLEALKRNLSGVDAQRWQGLMLTLSHLLFRRAPPTNQLHDILQSLVSGLDFEQRSSTGSSVGTGVRDAACFGVWALSRKYTTPELQALQPQPIIAFEGHALVGVLQKLAVELVCSACVDPSGNIRRGASAALQELIGRHPNIITEGIALVQAVDYHAVSRRSRAMNDVAKATASLDLTYWSPLLEALMSWRGIGSPDAESRRQAARSIGTLSLQEGHRTLNVVLQRLLAKLPRIPRSDVESRHGCFLSLATTTDTFVNELEMHPESRGTIEEKEVSSLITGLWKIFESRAGPTDDDLTLQNSRPELTAEASSCLIASLCRASSQVLGLERPSEALLDRALRVLSLSVSRSEDISIQTSSEALSTASGRGQILALGAVFKQLEEQNDLQGKIVTELLRCTWKDEIIEKRVVAVRCFATGILPHTGKLPALTNTIATSLIDFLNDYTTNMRGDVGSLIRVEAIQAARAIAPQLEGRSQIVLDLTGCLCRLACEKLDKVRLQAALCLQDCYWNLSDFNPFQTRFEHVSDVFIQEYFFQILGSWNQEWLRQPLLQGLSTSAVAGAEGLVRSTRAALIQFLSLPDSSSNQNTLTGFVEVLSTALSENLPDDRYAIPIVEVIAFLLDSYDAPTGSDLSPIFRKVFVLVQKSHFRSSNIARLEAAIQVYAALSKFESLRSDVLKKITGMLLHPFPRVRSTAADYLYTIVETEAIKYEDWSAPPKELKGKVESLRAVLVTG